MHGISFGMAKEIFADLFIVVQENIADEEEQRYHAIGRARSQVLLLVVEHRA